jgi:hypothetical protein
VAVDSAHANEAKAVRNDDCGGAGASAFGSAGQCAVPARSLLAARVCFVEAETSLADCAAITYVLRARAHRSGWSFERMAWAYSALGADNDRARFARELPGGDIEEWSPQQNAEWAQVRRVALLALEGRVRNPAPHATHWGARNLSGDVRRAERAIEQGRWRRVPSATLNAFYVEVRGKTLAAAEAAPAVAGVKP